MVKQSTDNNSKHSILELCGKQLHVKKIITNLTDKFPDPF